MISLSEFGRRATQLQQVSFESESPMATRRAVRRMTAVPIDGSDGRRGLGRYLSARLNIVRYVKRLTFSMLSPLTFSMLSLVWW